MKTFLKTSTILKIIEIIALFVISPVVLYLSIPIVVKLVYLFLGILYISLLSIFIEKFAKVTVDKKARLKSYRQISIRFLVIALSTIVILYFQDKDALFSVMLNKPTLWLKFSAIYILFSVIPQELIYRTFFVKRYQELFNNKLVFILTNSVLFSFAHIWFQSWIVLSFTFVGSLFFIDTYLKTKSTLLVIIEHSFYGVWLYTVGYGALFMFPT